MSILNFKNSNKFYINSITAGKTVKNEVRLTFNEENGNRVIINNLVPAFIKLTDQFTCEKEIIVSDLAFLLDVDVAMVYKTSNDRNEVGIISKSVCTPQELLISMDYVFKKIIKKISTGISTPTWVNEALNLPESSNLQPLNTEKELKILIDMGLNAIYEAFTIKDSYPNEFKKKYMSMILFDFITNQTKRNANDYSVIVNKDSKFAKLSPLYSNSEISTEKINTYAFNNRIVDRCALIQVLYKYYYPYIKELSQCLALHKETYLKSINLICGYNTSEENAKLISERIKENIEFIKELDEKISGTITENKIDYTQTTIRINQTVMKKNLLIQNKYPEKLLTKETLIVDAQPVEKNDLGIKISCEKPLKESGISNVFFITTVIAFISGLGIGIAYILMFFNK